MIAELDPLRAPEQVERFGLDPAKIGLLGSSAGAILAQTYATSGTGPTDEGSRVGAVVSLSGVSLLTEAALQLGVPSPEAAAMALNYLTDAGRWGDPRRALQVLPELGLPLSSDLQQVRAADE